MKYVFPFFYFYPGGGIVTKSCPTLLTPWNVACQAPLSTGFSRQQYWSGLPFPSPGDLPDPGIEPGSPALQADSLLTELWGKPQNGSFRCWLWIQLSPNTFILPMSLYLKWLSFLNYYWCIVDLKCVSFRCTAKWFRYMCMYVCVYIYIFFILFSFIGYIRY